VIKPTPKKLQLEVAPVSKPFNLADITEVRNVPLRSSGMSDLEACPFKYLMRHRAGLVPRVFYADALHRGDILHQGIALAVQGHTVSTIRAKLDSVLETMKAGFAKNVDSSGYLPGGRTYEEAAEKADENQKIAGAMIEAYCSFFEVKKGRIGKYKIDLATIEMGVGDSEYYGKFDCEGLEDETGDRWIIDHKSCSKSPVEYASTLEITPQTLLYRKLGDEFRKKPPVGIVYNIIQTPSIKCCKTDEFNFDKYVKRVQEWYAKNEDTMFRARIRLSAQGYTNGMKRIAQARDKAKALPILDNFQQHGGAACRAYNKTCSFLDICTSDVVTWPSKLARFDRDWREEEVD
jgi:hypothetical protein